MGGTAGAIAAAQASQQDYTAGGGVQTLAVPGGGTSAAAQLIKKGPGRLQNIVVTALASSAGWTLYDGTSAAGTIIGIVPATATKGLVIQLNMPVVFGIYASPDSSAAPPFTVSFN